MKYSKSNPSWPEVILGCAMVIFLIAAVTTLVAWVFQFGWNLVMPSVFGLPEITLLQSLGLLIVVEMVGGAFRSISGGSKSK